MFDTTEAPRKESRLIELAKRDVSEAQDNLARARNAAKYHDPAKKWGQSDQTLAEIIAGYESWEREALEALKAAREVSQ